MSSQVGKGVYLMNAVGLRRFENQHQDRKSAAKIIQISIK